MSAGAAVWDGPGGADAEAAAGEAFAFAPPDPVWAPLAGDRPRAAGRLVAFVAGAGFGVGLALWILGELAAAAIRGAL
jgi:hypothetical protein